MLNRPWWNNTKIGLVDKEGNMYFNISVKTDSIEGYEKDNS